jgi:hypothetical protein
VRGRSNGEDSLAVLEEDMLNVWITLLSSVSVEKENLIGPMRMDDGRQCAGRWEKWLCFDVAW